MLARECGHPRTLFERTHLARLAWLLLAGRLRQPLGKYFVILGFDQAEGDPHPRDRDVSDHARGCEDVLAIIDLHMDSGPSRQRVCRLDKTPETTQLSRLGCDNFARIWIDHKRSRFEWDSRELPRLRENCSFSFQIGLDRGLIDELFGSL